MRSTIKLIILIFLSFMYLSSYMGIWVHRCLGTGSMAVAILERSVLCNSTGDCSSDNTCHCHEHECGEGLDCHDETCCNTELYHSDDCTISKNNSQTDTDISKISPFVVVLFDHFVGSRLSFSIGYDRDDCGVLPFVQTASPSLLSCWRL